ncbi:MAG TPA: hypothetical protein VMW69_07305 [Spirochaetia bacterium]|nr:hypothetical protein [Spirochaetia bacterium]
MLVRRLAQLALAAAAALAAWSVLETLRALQPQFPSYPFYTTVYGTLSGLIFGAFLGCGEAIGTRSAVRVAKCASMGGLLGVIGGGIGFLAALKIVGLVGAHLVGNPHLIQMVAMPLAGGAGWAVMGAFIGAAARSGSARGAAVGALGGLVGALPGGLLVEYEWLWFPSFPFLHLVGLLLFGVSVVLARALLEKRFSFGVLRILGGPLKRREYLLTQGETVIGASSRCDIVIPFTGEAAAATRDATRPPVRGYRNIAETHCRIVAKGRDLFIAPLGGDVVVNGTRLDAQTKGGERESRSSGTEIFLKFDDVVACGTVCFLYKRG